MTEFQYIKRAEVIEADEELAVATFAEAVKQPDMTGVIFFCSADYDPGSLTDALNHYFDCPVVGCTSAGEIGSTYQNGGIVGLSFSSRVFALHPLIFADLDQLDPKTVRQGLAQVEQSLVFSDRLDRQRMFAYQLVDGLSFKEELLTDMLYRELKGVALIGGSAGDELEFKETRVFFKGSFHTNAAAMVIIETTMDFEIFKHQHIEPLDKDVVVTRSIPNRRAVLEIDGGPAAEEYARLVGVEVEDLGPKIFSMHPLMLEINHNWHVRSIKQMNDDGTLTFSCAIDTGLPLTLGHSRGLVKTLQKQVDLIHQHFSHVAVTLGCDCILRRVEMQENDDVAAVEGLLKQLNFTGFSTYGEQFNGVHINQTLVGIVIGEKAS